MKSRGSLYIRELADLLGVSKSNLYRWITKTGAGRWRDGQVSFDSAELTALIVVSGCRRAGIPPSCCFEAGRGVIRAFRRGEEELKLIAISTKEKFTIGLFSGDASPIAKSTRVFDLGVIRKEVEEQIRAEEFNKFGRIALGRTA